MRQRFEVYHIDVPTADLQEAHSPHSVEPVILTMLDLVRVDQQTLLPVHLLNLLRVRLLGHFEHLVRIQLEGGQDALYL